MRVKRVGPISVTTDASGDAEATTDLLNGLLLKLHYIPDASNPLDTGADLTITNELEETLVTHANIGTSAFTRLYRQLIAAAADGAASTTLYDHIPVCEKLTLTIANGGDTLSGVFYLYLGVRD